LDHILKNKTSENNHTNADRTGTVLAVCTSSQKGTEKQPVKSIHLISDWGIEGDAHAGHWHRQVSLLPAEAIKEFNIKLRASIMRAQDESVSDVSFGAFGENIVVRGMDLKKLPVGTKLRIGNCLLEISQIGKACHTHCAIAQKVGDCIMPREGIFAVVREGGIVKAGDQIEVIPADPERPFTAAIITLSDRASRGEYEDLSGPAIRERLVKDGYEVVEHFILPDGIQPLESELKRLADQRQVSVVFTTGGTGFSERDLTPEATKAASEREVPGIGEALRAYSMRFTDRAMLSRQTAGIRGKTLFVNLPGSPKACREDLDFLLPPLRHGLGILRGSATD
jgi:molybdopterin adenylyltransferase